MLAKTDALAAMEDMADALEALDAEPESTRWDFFWTTFRHKRLLRGKTREQYWMDRGALTGSLELEAESELYEAIEAARDAGFFGTGTSQVGVFEIHTPRGVYKHRRGFFNLAHAKESDIVFKSWDELDAEEEAA